MDWDMKTASSQWDWENLMLFPGKGTDIARKSQTSDWESETGGGDAGVDNGSLQNGSVYSPGCGSGSNFGYGSSSKSCISVECSAKIEPDLGKVKAESKELNCMEERNVVFLDLRSQVAPTAQDQGKGSSCEMRGSEEHYGSRHSFATTPDQQQQRLYMGSGCRTGNDLEGGKEMNRAEKNCSLLTAPGSAGSADSHIGLKLGKRTYFEDTSGGGSIKATPVSVFPASPSVPTKKPRALTQGMQTARCQVEGCNTDLTSSKDYHRRHKVCEIHSKSAKVMVAGLEQRFCQQCSRFHLLKEFDEGKRSCRRRLAGHNERRRKPQPNSMALNSARLSSCFYDNRRSGGILMDRPPFANTRFVSTSVLDDRSDFRFGHGKGTWPRIVKPEDQLIFDGHHQMPGVNRQSYASALSRHNADRLLLLMQSSKPTPGDILSQGIHHCSQGPVGQALTLSSSSGTGVFTGLEIESATQGLSGVSDSGCALSLLSSQSWGLRAPGSASMDLTTRQGAALEQFIHDSQPSMAQPLMQGMQHNFGLVADKFLASSSQASTSLVSSAFPEGGMNLVGKEHQPLVPDMGGIENFESSMHGLLQGQDFKGSHAASSKDVRRTIDLMHRSSQTPSNESQGQPGMVQHGTGQFMKFQLMRPYDSSVFDSQPL